MERDFKSIPEELKKRLKFSYEDRIQNIKEAIDRNYDFLLKIVSPYSSMFKFYLNVLFN
jgi:GTP1/Obg family GTP-binding protein